MPANLTLSLVDFMSGFFQDSVRLNRNPLDLIVADDHGPDWSDHITSNFFPELLLTDSFTTTDAFTQSLLNGVGFGDDLSQNWNELVLSNFFQGTTLSDSIYRMADAFSGKLITGLGFADQISMSDRMNYFVPQITDSLAILDGYTQSMIGLMQLSIIEQVSLSDAIQTFKTGGANFQLSISENSQQLLDSYTPLFSGTAAPPITSTGAAGGVTVSAGGTTLGVLGVTGTEVLFLDVIYRYANLDLPFSPNDPGLTFTYDNAALDEHVFLFARFFNLLNEPSAVPFPLDAGTLGPGAANIDCIDVRTTGAIGDGVTNDTAAIQKALDMAHENYLNALAGLITGPTRVCIPSGMLCMVGGGFWESSVGRAWPNNPGRVNGFGASPPAGSAIAMSNTEDFSGAIDGACFVRSGVTVQLDGTVKIITDPAQMIGVGPETTAFVYYDNDFATHRTFPSPTYVPPAKGVSMNAVMTGTGTIDGSMDAWLAGSGFAGPAADGYGIGVYASVGNNCQFVCEGITIKQVFGMGVYVEGNINDLNSYASAHVRDCVVDTFGSTGVNSFWIDATFPVMTGIAVCANGVEVTRNRVVNGLAGGIIQQFCVAYQIMGKNISLTSNSAKSVICGIWIGSHQRLGNRNIANGGVDTIKITANTLVGPFFDGVAAADITVPGIIFAAVLGDPFGGALHTDGVLDYVSGVDMGDNVVSGFYDGLQDNRNNFFLTSIEFQGGLWHVDIHDNSFTDNVAYGIDLVTPPGPTGFVDVNLWGNMELNNGLGSVSINGNVDTVAANNPVPGLGIGSVGPITPGGPPVISTPGGNLSGDPHIYEVYYYFEGTPTSGEEVFRMKMPRTVTFPANFVGSKCTVVVLPTQASTYTVLNGATTIGTIAISTGGVPTFTTTGGLPQVIVENAILRVLAPVPNDITLAGTEFTLVGVR